MYRALALVQRQSGDRLFYFYGCLCIGETLPEALRSISPPSRFAWIERTAEEQRPEGTTYKFPGNWTAALRYCEDFVVVDEETGDLFSMEPVHDHDEPSL